MRNLQLAIFMSFAPLCLSAQMLANTEGVAKNTAHANTAKPNNETPEQARTQVLSMLNFFTKSAMTPEETREAGIGEKEEMTAANDKLSFINYLGKIEIVLNKRMRKLEAEDSRNKISMVEKSELFRALNILKSANCLADRSNGLFVKQKDYDGQEIIAFQLDEFKGNARYGFVENYREGFSRIKKDQVYGFVNYCGDEVIPCQYETAEAFNNGRALVKKVAWFYTDANGKESEPLFNVADAQALKNGISIAKMKDGKCALIDNRYDATKKTTSDYYDEIKPFSGMDIFRVRIGNKYGLISLQGQVKLEPNYEAIEPSGVTYLYKITQNGKIGLMDTEWKIRFAPAYNSIGDFDVNGLAVAKEGENCRLLSNRTYKNSQIYKTIGAFNASKLAQIQNETGNFGLINTDLQVIADPIYFNIGEFNEIGLAPACRVDKKCGFVNTKGVEVITPVYEEVGQFNKHGLVVVRELTKDCNKNKVCKTDIVYSKLGQVIIAKANEKDVQTMKIHYELMDTLHSDKFVAVKMFINDENQGFQLIDAGTFRLITNTPYQGISPYDANGILRIKKDNLWGLMDTLGKIILPPTYQEIRKLNDGMYATKDDKDNFGFIDKKAKIQIPFEYDEVKFFKNGHCVVTKGKEKWGLINKFNAKIVPLAFKTVAVRADQYEMTDDKGNIYIINEKGDCQQNCQKFEEFRKKANK